MANAIPQIPGKPWTRFVGFFIVGAVLAADFFGWIPDGTAGQVINGLGLVAAYLAPSAVVRTAA